MKSRDLTSIIEAIHNADLSSPFMIAIDGRGGSGKSTLSRSIAGQFANTKIVEFDDFYYPVAERNVQTENEDFNFDWRRLERQVLQPLHDKQEARYQRYNWTENKDDGLVAGHTIQPDGIVIIEGCYSLRPELRAYYDVTIWVECDKAVCFERGIQRTIALKHNYWNQPTRLEEQWHNFQALEDMYIAKYTPQNHADIFYET